MTRFLTCLMSLALLACTAHAAERPNLIFIIVDDMGYADAGCYGSTAIATPNLDAMAKRGMRFTDAYSGCTVCAPARSTLMSGMHMGKTPLRGNTGGIPLPAETVTTAEVLKQAGYATGGFGKWGLGDLDTEGAAEKQGFDKFYGYYHQIHAHRFYPDYVIDTGKKVALPGNKDFYKHNKHAGGQPDEDHGHKRQYTHDLVKREMFDWIRAHKDRPFFCYAPWTPPHAEYRLPASDPAWQMYADKPWSINARVHAAFVSQVDRHVGELYALLDELGIAENTVVMFCSDNGASNRFEGELDSSGVFKGRKRAMYEGGLRVPWIVTWPGKVEAGAVSDLPIYFPDVMPTLAAMAGGSAHVPGGIDGIDFGPELVGQTMTGQRERALYWEWPAYDWGKRKYTGEMMQGLRRGKWKIARHSNSDPWELYDLSQDLGENNNLAAKHPQLVKELDALTKSMRTEMPPQREPEMPKGKRFR